MYRLLGHVEPSRMTQHRQELLEPRSRQRSLASGRPLRCVKQARGSARFPQPFLYIIGARALNTITTGSMGSCEFISVLPPNRLSLLSVQLTGLGTPNLKLSISPVEARPCFSRAFFIACNSSALP